MEIFHKRHDGTLMKYEADPPIKDVVVRKQIKGIDQCCFFNNKNIVSIELPETVKVIGSNAFKNCSSLETVSGLVGVTEINSWAFMNCKKLDRFDIPESCVVDGTAFKGCLKWYDDKGFLIINNKLCHFRGRVSEVVIPDTVSVIGEGAFEENLMLESVTFPEGLNQICKHAFRGCKNLLQINIPSNLECIGRDAFAGCENLNMKIVLPEKTKTANFEKSGIKEIVFTNQTVNEEILFTNRTVNELPYSFVRGCKQLERVTVPVTVKYLLDNFTGCTSLKEIIAPGTHLKYIGITGLGSPRIKYPDFIREAAVAGFIRCYDKYIENVFDEYIDYLNKMLLKYAAMIIKNDACELLEIIDSEGNSVQKYKEDLLIPLAKAYGASKCLGFLTNLEIKKEKQ